MDTLNRLSNYQKVIKLAQGLLSECMIWNNFSPESIVFGMEYVESMNNQNLCLRIINAVDLYQLTNIVA
jgi:hypothetical protein